LTGRIDALARATEVVQLGAVLGACVR